MVNGSFRYAIGCFELPLKLNYQDRGITPQWQNIRCAFNKHLHTTCRNTEQLLAGRSALVVAVWAIVDYLTSDVCTARPSRSPPGLEMTAGRADSWLAGFYNCT